MELFTPYQLKAMADPEWFIERLFPTGAFVVLYSPPGSGKSWIALDWAFHIALGMPWQGLSTKQAPVIYIAAEGRGGLGQRIGAWLTKYRPGDIPVYFSLQPLDVLEDGPEELTAACSLFTPDLGEPEIDLVPGLIIIDTLARCFTGDENETADMARFVAGVDTLRQQLGATVLVVHHMGKDRSRGERGSSVLRGAADTMIRVVRNKQDDVMLLKCSKQKDAVEFGDIELRLETVGESCVIAPGCTVEQGAKLVLADSTLVSTLAKARHMANLTGLPIETCRNHLRAVY